MRSHHDMGGQPAGPVDAAEHHNALWEKRVDAMMMLLSGGNAPLFTVDQVRRAIEGLPPDAYDRMAYYERWLFAIAAVMKEKGVLTQDEIDARVKEVRARKGAA
jgi:hypothetical protein